MRALPLLVLFCCSALVLPSPREARAESVVVERGLLTGRASLAPIFMGSLPTVTGAFTFDPGTEDVPGLDYAAASPGTYSLVINPFTLEWSGSFQAPGETPQLSFAIDNGSYTTTIVGFSVVVGDTLDISSPLSSIVVLPPLPGLPPNITDPVVAAHVTVTAVSLLGNTPVAFDFAGDYVLTATRTPIPEPASLALLGAGLSLLLGRGRLAGARPFVEGRGSGGRWTAGELR